MAGPVHAVHPPPPPWHEAAVQEAGGTVRAARLAAREAHPLDHVPHAKQGALLLACAHYNPWVRRVGLPVRA